MMPARLIAGLLSAAVLVSAPCAAGAASSSAAGGVRGEFPGQAFSFGHSPDRGSPLWTRGVEAAALARRSAGVKDAPARKAIEKALEEAAGSRPHSGFGMSMKKEDRTWRKQPAARPDEKLNLDSRHVVRAYADFATSPDLSVNVGPELILKNERNNMSKMSNNDQPDSAIGLGMNFRLDF